MTRIFNFQSLKNQDLNINLNKIFKSDLQIF